jgi:hypothetical protein
MLKLRPSPTISATKNNIGTIKRGNDGHRYIVKKTSNGIKRWVRYNKKTSKKVSKKKSFKKGSKKGSKRISKKKSKKGSKRISKKKSKKGSKRISKKKSKKGSKRISKKKSKKGSKRISKKKSKKGSKRISKKKSKKGSKRISKKKSKKGSKRISKKKSKKGSKRIFKKKSKKISKKESKKSTKVNYPEKPNISKLSREQTIKEFLKIGRMWERKTKRSQDLGHIKDLTLSKIKKSLSDYWSPAVIKIWTEYSQTGAGTDWMDLDCDAGYILNKDTGDCEEIKINGRSGRSLVPHSRIRTSLYDMQVDNKDGKIYNPKTGRYERITMNSTTNRLNKY